MTATAPRETPPTIGVLMLETRFPRFAGDIGDATSMPWPTRYRRVPTASVARVVRGEPVPAALVARFVAAGRELVADGAGLVTTSCGFLHAAQAPLEQALSVPVVTSSLTLLGDVHARHGDAGPIGILTFDARALGAVHLGAGAAVPTVVRGMERSRHFHRVIAADLPRADFAAMEADAVAAARELARERPGAVILECTNLSPYREAITAAIGGRPLFDLHDAIAWRIARSR